MKTQRFFYTKTLSNHEINNFILLLQKGVYLYLGYWKKFNKTSLPEKEEFYSKLTVEDITDSDYTHGKKVLKRLKKKTTQENIMIFMFKAILYCQLMYLKIFEICFFAINELDHAHFLFASGLAWQTGLRETKVELDLLTNIDMLLLLEKGMRG